LSTVAAANAAVGGRRPGLKVLAAGGGLLAGTALAAWQIHRYHARQEADPERLGPPVDPLADETASGEPAAERVPLPPVARSLLLGAAVSAGLRGIAFAENGLSRGIAAGMRRAVPGAGPVAGVLGHAAAFGVTLAGLRFAVEYLNHRAEAGGSAIDAAYTTPPDTQTVSGGPGSAVAWLSLSREGGRFVNLALTPQGIAEGTGGPVAPVPAPRRAGPRLASRPTP